MVSDQIEYKLIGDDLQGVIITLDPEEAVVAEAGAMMYMQDGIRMMTTLDQTGRGGVRLVDRLMSAGKRVLSGDSFFVTIYLNASRRRVRVPVSREDSGHRAPEVGRNAHRAKGCLSLRRTRSRRVHRLRQAHRRRILRG